MKYYDIGILSFWDVPNYGTYAQEYALQKVIESLLPDRNVKQIAHLDQRHYDFYYDQRAFYRSFPIYKKIYWKSLKNVKLDELSKTEIHVKRDQFKKAYRSILHTEEINKLNVSNFSFSNIVLGSDIIWDFTQNVFNHDPLLFGLKFKADTVSSYAASFGIARDNTEIPLYVKKGIGRLRNISVRDENSANIIEKITGKRPTIVLDPVWLWDFQNDYNIVEPQEKDYILIYGQDFTDNFIKNLIIYAKKNQLKMIALDCNADHYHWCDLLIKQSELSPMDWISYFKGASAVATSTFHGLTFGLLFNKKIAFCKTDFIMAKVQMFLKNIGIDNVFEDKNDVYTMLDYSWDYKNINEYINIEKKKSLEYLIKACKKNDE